MQDKKKNFSPMLSSFRTTAFGAFDSIFSLQVRCNSQSLLFELLSVLTQMIRHLTKWECEPDFGHS
jgi:hypothetical protein